MRIEDVVAYPLCWPDGWPRTKSRDQGHPFGSRTYPLTFDRARRQLGDELTRLGAKGVIVSTNIALRNDGEPNASAARTRQTDPGVAVYFMLKGKQMVMAQDKYDEIAANLRSLALAIDGMRQLERHGGGTMMERAFAGFTALPAPEGSRPKRPWWIVLNYGDSDEARADLTVDEVEARFRALAKKRHPDTDGGSVELMAELNEARDVAVRALGGG